MRKISLALSLFLLTGCAQFNSGWGEKSDHNIDPYAQPGIDELLAFGANMANIPASSRVKVCHTLLKREKGTPGAGVLLHQMVGRLLSDACGEIPGILDGLSSIPPGRLPDERVQRLVSIDTEALKQLLDVSEKLDSLERKHNKLQSQQLGSKKSSRSKKNSNKSKKGADESKINETQLLREKLKAIRSMEKLLDESSNGN